MLSVHTHAQFKPSGSEPRAIDSIAYFSRPFLLGLPDHFLLGRSGRFRTPTDPFFKIMNHIILYPLTSRLFHIT